METIKLQSTTIPVGSARMGVGVSYTGKKKIGSERAFTTTKLLTTQNVLFTLLKHCRYRKHKNFHCLDLVCMARKCSKC